MGKLVRDLVPDLERARGSSFTTRVLEGGEYRQALLTKLGEESAEAQRTTDEASLREELADVLEVLSSLAELLPGGMAGIEEARRNKHRDRGGFAGRIYMDEYVPGDRGA
jgi:predicted house-cleaning noncanonical NTP pyrophosphatase (MazG superfamily)